MIIFTNCGCKKIKHWNVVFISIYLLTYLLFRSTCLVTNYTKLPKLFEWKHVFKLQSHNNANIHVTKISDIVTKSDLMAIWAIEINIALAPSSGSKRVSKVSRFESAITYLSIRMNVSSFIHRFKYGEYRVSFNSMCNQSFKRITI